MAITQAELEKMIENTMRLTLDLWEKQMAINSTMEFLIYETLKLQALYLRDNRKTPYKRLNELEQLVTGAIAYFNNKMVELTPSLKKERKDVI